MCAPLFRACLQNCDLLLRYLQAVDIPCGVAVYTFDGRAIDAVQSLVEVPRVAAVGAFDGRAVITMKLADFVEPQSITALCYRLDGSGGRDRWFGGAIPQ